MYNILHLLEVYLYKLMFGCNSWTSECHEVHVSGADRPRNHVGFYLLPFKHSLDRK